MPAFGRTIFLKPQVEQKRSNLFILSSFKDNMTFEVVIGHSKKDVEKYGKEGTVLIGKQYVQMGQTTSLSNPVYLDVAGAHVVFIVGKRGSGKSYSLGAIAEGLSDLPTEIKQNLSIILLDTMGIYWTMKYPNFQDSELARSWN